MLLTLALLLCFPATAWGQDYNLCVVSDGSPVTAGCGQDCDSGPGLLPTIAAALEATAGCGADVNQRIRTKLRQWIQTSIKQMPQREVAERLHHRVLYPRVFTLEFQQPAFDALTL